MPSSGKPTTGAITESSSTNVLSSPSQSAAAAPRPQRWRWSCRSRQVNQSPSRCGGGATLIASSMVVRPAATFIAALIRSGFMPSL